MAKGNWGIGDNFVKGRESQGQNQIRQQIPQEEFEKEQFPPIDSKNFEFIGSHDSRESGHQERKEEDYRRSWNHNFP
jgi:hypothetical protein